MYVHCIIKDKDVVSAIKELEGIKKVSWDRYFDTAVHWSAKEMQEKPDLILCEGFAVNSTLDIKTGKLNRDKIVLEALKEIRFNLPETRVVILLQRNRVFHKQFIQYLVSLGIYDLHFIDSFGVDELKQFIFGKPRNLKDVATHLDTIDIEPGTESSTETAFKQKGADKDTEANKHSLVKLNLSSFKNRIKNALLSQSSESKKTPVVTVAEKAIDEAVKSNEQTEPKKAESGSTKNAVCTAKNQVHTTGSKSTLPKISPLIKTPLKAWQTRVYIVAGVNHRVGATSFALALAKILSKKTDVEILDAGGGAAKWLGRKINGIFVRQGPASNISPGIFTLVDVGTEIPEEVIPMAEGIFVVTDLSRNAMNLRAFKNYRCLLVGNRGANRGGILELANLWNFSFFCTLPEDNRVRQAEIDGSIPMPSTWKKALINGLKLIEKRGV